MADYIFTVEGLLDKSKILSDFQGIKNTIEGQDLIIHFDGDPKSLKGLIDQIKAQKPEAKITFQADKKSMEQIFGNLEGKAFQFDPNNAKLRQAFDDIQKVAEKRLAGVDLSKFYAEAANAFIDPTKSGLELLDVISKISDKINMLAGITNRLSLRDLGPSDLDEVLKRAQALADIRKQIADEKKDNRKYGDFTDLKEAEKKAIDNTFGQGERKQPIGQKRIDDAIKSLGLKNDVKRDYGETLKEYARYSEYANELYEKLNGVKFNQITSKTDAKERLNQAQELIAISKKAAEIEGQLKKKGVLSEGQSLLPEKPDKLIQGIGNKAAKAYTDVLMKSLTNAEAQAENNLNQYIANKSKQRTTEGVGRAEKTSAKTEEIVEKNTARTRRRTKQGGGEGTSEGGSSSGGGGPAETVGDYERATGAAEGLGQAGRAAGEGVAAGAQAASESIGELEAKLTGARSKLEELQKMNKPLQDLNNFDFRKIIRGELDKLDQMVKGKAPKEEIEKQQKKILDLGKTYSGDYEKEDNSDRYKTAFKKVKESLPSYEPQKLTSFGDNKAIEEQIQLIQELESKIEQVKKQQQTPPADGAGVSGITDDIKQLEAELEQAKTKLNDLKEGYNLDGVSLTKDSKETKALTRELDRILEKYKQMGDISGEEFERASQIYNLLYQNKLFDNIKNGKNALPKDLVEKYGTGFFDLQEKYDPYENKEIPKLTSIIDVDAIRAQENEIDRITQKIEELKKQRTEGLDQRQKKVGEAKTSDAIETPLEDRNIKITVDNGQAIEGINEVKSTLESIPDSKEIKISTIDYDKLPLLSDASGKTIDAFRGVHGVFGFSGKDGVSWFTDELEMASQYADSLAEDGKILRANLAFKNPLEIWGNGADYDKLDLRNQSKAFQDSAKRMGFDVQKMLTDNVVQVAKSIGHDGVIFRQIKDGFDKEDHNVFATIDQAQVKNEQIYKSMHRISNEDVKSMLSGDNGSSRRAANLEEEADAAEKTADAYNNISESIQGIEKSYNENQRQKDTSQLEEQYKNIIGLNQKLSSISEKYPIEDFYYDENQIPKYDYLKDNNDFISALENYYQPDKAKELMDDLRVQFEEYSNYEKEFQNAHKANAFVTDFSDMSFDKQLQFFDEIAQGTQQGKQNLKELDNYYVDMRAVLKDGSTKSVNLFDDFGDTFKLFAGIRDQITGFKFDGIFLDDMQGNLEGMATSIGSSIQNILSPIFSNLHTQISEAFKLDDDYLSSFFKAFNQFDSEENGFFTEAIDNIIDRRDDYVSQLQDAFYSKLKDTNAPNELIKTYNDLFKSINNDEKFPSADSAIEQMNEKVKELGVTFDDTQKKWIQLSSSASDGVEGSLEKKTEEIKEEGWAADEAADKKKEFADANERISTVTNSKPVEKMADAIDEEKQSAEKAKIEKEEFADANEKVAKSSEASWDFDQINTLLQNIEELKTNVIGISESFDAFSSSLDISSATEGMQNLSSAIEEVQRKMDTLSSSTNNLDFDGLKEAFGANTGEFSSKIDETVEKLGEYQSILSQGLGIGVEGVEAPINSLVNSLNMLLEQLAEIKDNSTIDIQLSDRGNNKDVTVKVDDIKTDLKESEQKLGFDAKGSISDIESILEQQEEGLKEVTEKANELKDIAEEAKDAVNDAEQAAGDITVALDENAKGNETAQADKIEDLKNQINEYQKLSKEYLKQMRNIKSWEKSHNGDTSLIQNTVDHADNIKSQLDEMKKAISESKALTEELKTSFELIDETLTMGMDKINGNTIQKDEFADAATGYDTLISKLQRIVELDDKVSKGKNLTSNQQSFWNKYGTQYRDAMNEMNLFDTQDDKAIEKAKKFKEAVLEMQKALAESKMNNLSSVLDDLGNDTLTEEGTQKLNQLREELERLKETVDSFKGLNIDDQIVNKDTISSAIKDMNTLEKKVENFNSDRTNILANQNRVSSLDAKMAKAQLNYSGNKELVQNIQVLRDSLNGISAQGLNDVEVSFDEIISKAAEAGNLSKSFGDTLKKSFQGLARYLMTYVGFYEVVDALKQAVNIVKELDTGLMEVRKVSTEPLSNLKDWQKDTFRQADMVGSTAQQIQESTASWLRLGKSFTEAQDAAVASNWLLNVSEFENIDEATTSLMSITQAFNDLSFEDVIDKLNAVGDSYSSSTDQLASGLQNAAAVLKIQGNDIDKSLALLTAGNDITQDMSKTSAGIRTISLRIAGTEEAKNEIADLGEDVDDFVVRTRSKTDKIVRDYTAVASNDFKGVSVLDSKGGLRDTYDILLDIADIYKEIQETDKKAGTNRAQALVEELAGKNRSNILASILQNPELLRNAYNTSVNSAGVGMKELEAYTDSVSAKMQTLQNHLQELATVTIDSEWLKDLIDLGTSAVEIVTQLLDKIGGLEGVAGILGGLFAQGKGWGFVTPKDKEGKRELGFLGNVFSKLGGFIDKGLTNGFKNAFRDVFKSDQRDAAKWLRGFDQDASIKDMFGFTGNETDSRVRETLIDNGATDKIADTLADMFSENLDEPISNLVNGLGDIGSIGGVIKSGIKDFGVGLLSSVGTMSVSMIASGILSLLGNWAVKKITGQEHTEKIQAGQQAAAQNKQSRERIETIEDTGNKALERYNKLRQGVYMNGNIAKNISLSSDEYAEFLDISQQLADVFPSLQTGVTDAGQSLVDLGTDADEATEKLQKMIDAEKQINVNDIKSKMDKTTTGIAEKNKEFEDSIKAEESRIAGIQRIQSSLQDLKVGANEVDFGDFKTYKESAKILMNMLDDVGIGYAGFMDPGNMGVLKFNVDKDSLQDVKNVFAAYQDILNGNMQTAQDSIESFEDQEQANWLTNFLPDFKEILESDPAFINMGEDINNGIFEMLNKIDYPAMYEMLGDDLKPDERYDEALANAIITPFETALASEDIKPIDLSNFLEFNFDDLSNEDMRDAINGMLDKVFPGGEGTNDYKIKQMILVEFGYKYEDEDGNTHWNATDTRASLWEKLGGEVTKNTSGKNVFNQGTSPIKWEDFKQISQEYQQIMSEMEGDFHFTGDSFEALIDYLHQWKVAQEQIEEKPIGKLSDIFENENFQQDTQKAEQNISTLQTAIDNFRESGKLTSEQLTNLYSSIPELAKYGDDLTLENLGDELWKNVQDYGKTFNQAVSDLDLSPDEISAATNYLQSYFDQFADAPLSINQAKDALHDFIVTTTDVKSPAEAAQRGVEEKRYNDILTQLSDTGREIDWEVVMQIMADPSMANATAEEFVAEYDQKEITIHAKIEFEDMQRDLQNYIEGKESGISAQQALISAKQAAGERVTAEDYMSIRTNQAAIVGSNKRLYDMAYENLQNAKMPEDIKYWQNEANKAFATWQNSQADYIQYQKDSREADVNYLNQVASEHEALGERLNNEKTQIEESGRMIDHKLASQIARNRQDQIATQEAIAAENENLYSIYGDSSYLQSANTARAAAQTIRDSGTTTQQIISESQVASLNADLTELQDKATTIQDAITLQEGQGLKPTLDQYNQLLDNGAKQIDNLEKQNRLLGNQQVGLRRNSARWREIQSQINANNSAISQMNGNLNNWRDSIKNFAGDIGNTLLSALQNAFNESISSTGLQYGTMKELAAQFEGLQGFDFADIFYNTAQGVKLDARATQTLVDAQYDLMTNDLTSQINEQNAALAQLTQQYNNTSDAAQKMQISSKMDTGFENLNNLYNQLAQYQAFYAEAQKLFSSFGEFQRAQQTANAGDTYNTLQGYLKTQEEAWQSGEVGTDDFKAYTALFDEWGRDTLAAYNQNRDKIQRYLTDDSKGVANMLEDLVAHGYAEKLGPGNYKFGQMNVEEAAHALGISKEFLEYSFGRMEDYGATNNYVKSQIDGELKLQEAAHDTAEAIRRKNDLIRQGAPTDVIAEAEQQIEDLQQRSTELYSNTEAIMRDSGKIYAKDIKAGVDTINELNEAMQKATTEGEKNAYRTAIRDAAREFGNIPLNADLTVNTEELDKLYEGWDQATKTPTVKKSVYSVSDEFLSDFSEESVNSEAVKNTETLASGVQKIKDNWQDNKKQLLDYVNQLRDANAEQLEGIKMNDGKYDEGLEDYEKALDGIATTLGMTKEEAENIVPLLQGLGILATSIEQSASQAYDRAMIGKKQYSTTNAERIFAGTQYEGATNFDTALMSTSQLEAKMKEINNMKAKLNLDTTDGKAAEQELNDLYEACQKQYEIKINADNALDKLGMTADQFLELDEQSRKDMLVNAGVEMDDSEYRAFVEECESRQVRTKIDAVLSENAELTIHDIANMKDEEITQYFNVEGKEQIDAIRDEAKALEAETVDMTVALSTDSLSGISDAISAALNGETYEAYIKGNAEDVSSSVEDAVSGDYTAEVGIEVTGEENLDKVARKEKVQRVRVETYEPAGNKQAAKTQTVQKSQTSSNINFTSNLQTIYQQLNTIRQSASKAIELKISGSSIATGIRQIQSGIDNLRSTASEAINLSINIEDATSKIEEISSQIATAGNEPVSIKANIDEVIEAIETIKAAVKSANPTMHIQGDGSKALSVARAAYAAINAMNPQIKIGANGAQALSTARAAVSAINAMNAKITLGVDGSGALSSARALVSAINAMHATISVSANTNVTSGAGGSGKIAGAASRINSRATGTVTSVKSYAGGTTNNNKPYPYNVINYSKAYSIGDVALKEDQIALTGELGPELLVRNGMATLIPGGAHLEVLRQGDIIFSASQTKAILKGMNGGLGKVIGSARAYAEGSVKDLFKGIPAYPTGTARANQGAVYNIYGGSNTFGSNSDIISVDKDYTSGGIQFTSSGQPSDPGGSGGSGSGGSGSGGSGGSGGGGGGDTGEQDKPQYSEDIFDFVEIRLQYFADATKKIADKITDYVNKVTKGKLLRQEIDAVRAEIEANSRAANSYRYWAERTAQSYTYTDKDNNRQTVKLTDSPYFSNLELLRSGYFGEDDIRAIETTNPDQAAYAEAARQYIDYVNKANDANNAMRELTNSMRELYDQMIQLPTEKLEKALAKIEKRIETISTAEDAIGDRSAILMAQRTLNAITGLTASFGGKLSDTYDLSSKSKDYNALRNTDKGTGRATEGLSTAVAKSITASIKNSGLQEEYDKIKARYDVAIEKKNEANTNRKTAANMQQQYASRIKASDWFKGLEATARSKIENGLNSNWQFNVNNLVGDKVTGDLKKQVELYNNWYTKRMGHQDEFELAKSEANSIKEQLDKVSKQLQNSSNNIADTADAIASADKGTTTSNKDAVAAALARYTAPANVIRQTNTSDPSKMTPTWKIQNQFLDQEFAQLFSSSGKGGKVDELRNALIEQEKVTEELRSRLANTKAQANSAANTLKANAPDSAYIKTQISKRAIIDTTVIDKKYAEAAAQYNSYISDEANLKSAIVDAVDKEQELTEEANQVALEIAKRSVEMAQLKVENIAKWYDTLVDWTDTFTSKLQKQREVWKQLGTTAETTGRTIGNNTIGHSIVDATVNAAGRTTLTQGITYSPVNGEETIAEGSAVDMLRDSYQAEIGYNKENLAKRKEQVRLMRQQLQQLVDTGRIEESSEKYKELEGSIRAVENEVQDLTISIDKLYSQMLEDVYFKPINTAIQNTEKLRKSLESLEGLITSDMMYTEDGSFTQLGIAKYTLDVKEYKEAQDELTKLEEARMNLNNLYNTKPNGTNAFQLSTDEYQKNLEEIQEQERQVLSSMASTRQEVIKDVTDRYQTEITYINKLIDARRREIQKKRELYEYDRKLKKQTREVQLIEQQIRALNGLIN